MDLLQTYLDEKDKQYDEEFHAFGDEFSGPGYHTRIPNGTYAHETRANMTYVVGLLASGKPHHLDRAQDVLRNLLKLQDQDPMSETYGLWSWLMEEPLSEMNPPDWNWADFIGADLCTIIGQYEDRLPADLREAACMALTHAAYCIFRRNVQPAYTNIAIKGATVTTLAGELLDEPQLLRYGRRRWQRIVEHYVTDPVGSTEYNSPTYANVALRETSRLLRLAKDPEARRLAEAMHHWLWQMVAEHYHPATGQWAGPHGRAYRDYLDEGYATVISKATGVDIPVHPEARRGGGWQAVERLPCPDDLIPRFRQLPEPDYSIRRLFIRRENDFYTQWATTWFSEQATLGTANRDITWIQRHHLIGYWHTPETQSVVLRFQFLKNSVDFSSGIVTHEQDGPRVLSLLTLAANLGDYHFRLNKPERSVYEAGDIRLRWSLRGAGGSVKQDANGRFILTAGDYRAVIHPARSIFAGQPVRWETGKDEATNTVFVDAVCYSGPTRSFDMIDIGPETYVAAGLELLSAVETVTPSAPETHATDETVRIHWRNLSVDSRRRAEFIEY